MLGESSPKINMVSKRFPKSERLCSKNAIDQLFAQGKNLRKGHLLLKYLLLEEALHEQRIGVLIAVPKSRLKKAVARNTIKRRLRELYRHYRHTLGLEAIPANKTLIIAVIYSANEPRSYREMEPDFQWLCQKLAAKLSGN